MPSTALRRSSEGRSPADLLMAANSRSNAEATVDKAFAASGKAHAHVHWQIRETLRGTVPIPGTVT